MLAKNARRGITAEQRACLRSHPGGIA